MNTPQPTPAPTPSQTDIEELTAWHAARDNDALQVLIAYWDDITAFVYAHEDLRPTGPDWETGLLDYLAGLPLPRRHTDDYDRGWRVGRQLASAAEWVTTPLDDRATHLATFPRPPDPDTIDLAAWLTRPAA